MPWTATVSTDKDKADVGSANAIYTDGDFSFSYGRRIKMTVAEKNAFATEARSALALQQTIDSRNENLSTLLTDALNA